MKMAPPPPIEVTATGCVIPAAFFPFAKATLVPGTEERLLECVELVLDHIRKGGRVVLIASTDGLGDHERVNLPLSAARGQTVKAVFEARGIAGSAIEIVAIGEAGAIDGVADPDRRRVTVELR